MRVCLSLCHQEAHATTEQRAFIRDEARHLFRANQGLTDQEAIKRCITEAQARLEIGERFNTYRITQFT